MLSFTVLCSASKDSFFVAKICQNLMCQADNDKLKVAAHVTYSVFTWNHSSNQSIIFDGDSSHLLMLYLTGETFGIPFQNFGI